MSQIFDYFACSRATIERWAEALAGGDEDLREEIEFGFSGVLSFRNLGPDAVGILAHCAKGEPADVVEAVGAVELIRAVDEQEGPWVMAFHLTAIAALATLGLDDSLLQRWVRAVSEFNGQCEDENRQLLTREAAQHLKDLCTTAVNGRMGVFCCFYG